LRKEVGETASGVFVGLGLGMQAGRALKRTKLQFATDVIELLFFCGPVDVLAAIARSAEEHGRKNAVEASWNATALKKTVTCP
jgi:hypothetical protein